MRINVFCSNIVIKWNSGNCLHCLVLFQPTFVCSFFTTNCFVSFFYSKNFFPSSNLVSRIVWCNLNSNISWFKIKSWRLNIGYGLTIISFGTIAVLLFARPLMRSFTADIHVIEIGIEYLRIAALFFFAYVFLNISVATLQGMKKPLYAIFVGVYRQFLMPLPLFVFLAIYLEWGTKGIDLHCSLPINMHSRLHPLWRLNWN